MVPSGRLGVKRYILVSTTEAYRTEMSGYFSSSTDCVMHTLCGVCVKVTIITAHTLASKRQLLKYTMLDIYES